MNRFKAALSLYVALAVHLLLILLLVLGTGSRQSLSGSGSGLGGDDAVAPAVNDAAAVSAPREVARQASLRSDALTLAATPIELQPTAVEATPENKPVSASAPASAGSGRAGGGSGGYMAQVRAQLSRHRRSLPGVLTSAHSEVAFSIAADGGVSDVTLVESSGIAVLDAEATALVLRASPLPPPPDGKPRRLSVPVSVEPPKL
ncbi:MAG: hypothetical protein JWQ90_5419 [Hydrocarboniphaga sp.]|uniref:TonB family protein n=1 Tax=Hydrocarboniphaga sp. TaxID=2033016 RepID=UPI0026204E30|nr:TonB family protein [Hydrocarboniphaga sp.]MDB5972969.1 hypothetical protein [Hydrocarboniphaga sp.]